MKISLLTTLSFLLLAFATKPLLVRSNSAHLLDITGNKIQSTRHYYAVSAIREAGGGGLALHPGRNQRCPLDVIQLRSDQQQGIKLRFSPADNSSTIRESTDLNVKFSTLRGGACQEQTVWKVDNYDESRGKWYITTGGVEGNPGPQTLQNWFKLEKSKNPDAYKIVHCPSVSKSCAKLCYNVGISNEDGTRRLALVPDNEQALHVMLIAKERSMSVYYSK